MKREVDNLPVELQLVVDSMQDRLQKFSKLGRNPSGLTQMAQLALDQDDFLRASVFLAEAVELACESGLQGNESENRKLKTVRNWLAHAGKLGSNSKSKSVQKWVTDRTKLREFFRLHIKRLTQELR